MGAEVIKNDTSNFKAKISGDLVKVLSSLDLPSDLKADLAVETKKGITRAGTANIQFEYHIAQLTKDAIKERKEKCILPSDVPNGRRLVEGIGYVKLASRIHPLLFKIF